MDIVKREFIFEDQRPFPACHASTLVKLPGDEYLAAWFGGSREAADDTAIWTSRRQQGKWTAPVKTADQEGMPHWNPVLFTSRDANIHLYYKVGKTIPQWHTMHTFSTDGGKSWIDPQELVPGDIGGRGPVKNKPIIMADGSWVAPASREGKFWDAFVDISQDEGRSWTPSSLVPFQHSDDYMGKGIIQPCLWESSPGTLHMLLRSTAGVIFRSDSDDGGKTWSPAYSSGLPNNNSGIDCVQTASGDIVLVYNPVGMTSGPRTPLMAARLTDNGRIWHQEAVLEIDPGEYSYPAVIAEGNRVYISYTWNRERIVFAELSC